MRSNVFFVTFQDGIFDQLYECTLNYYKGYFHHISFPEMVIPSIVAVRFIARFLLDTVH